MAPLPNVKISLANGQLGRTVQISDGVAALVGHGVATSGLVLGVPKQIFGTAQLAALGVTEANNLTLYRQVHDFYRMAGEGSELWLMILPPTLTMDLICNKTQSNGLINLLTMAQGRVRIVGIFSTVLGTKTTGLDSKMWVAITNAQALAEEQAIKQNPLRILLGAFNYEESLATLPDLTQRDDNRVGVVLSGPYEGESGIGLALGRAAAVPAQRKISRVKDGDLQIEQVYVGNNLYESITAETETYASKGYIVMRKFPAKNGYFFGGDHMATADTDDYSLLANGRVIDKAQIVSYLTLVEELDTEVPIENGKLSRGFVAYMEGLLLDRLETALAGQVSSISAYVDPNQDVLGTSKIVVVLKITPVGYASEIEVALGFSTI